MESGSQILENLQSLEKCRYDGLPLLDWGTMSADGLLTRQCVGCMAVYELNEVTGMVYIHESNTGMLYCATCGTLMPGEFLYCSRCESEPERKIFSIINYSLRPTPHSLRVSSSPTLSPTPNSLDFTAEPVYIFSPVFTKVLGCHR